jgi:hypothetical protein
MSMRVAIPFAVALSVGGMSDGRADWCREVIIPPWDAVPVITKPWPNGRIVEYLYGETIIVQRSPLIANPFGVWARIAHPTYGGPRGGGWVVEYYLGRRHPCYS